MSKKIDWNSIYTGSVDRKSPGQSLSFKERMEKAYSSLELQKHATETSSHLLAAMEKLLEIRILNKSSFKVLRPLKYNASEFYVPGMEDFDDPFYNISDSEKEMRKSKGKFRDVVKTVNPGEWLFFKSLDMNLQELVFTDSKNNEIAISFSDKKNLMMATDIKEVTESLFNRGEEE